MQILTKRLNITEATITFGGDLVPLIDLEATTTSGGATITINLTGLASNPSVTFTSSPALPQDEILAQLIFGQSMARLSALQIAQLADAAAQLAGGRGTSLFQSLRTSLGIDDLDVSTDETGQTSISAGKYLNDRTYLELQQNGSGGAKAVINLDIGRGVKLKGEAGGDGAGGGIFYEKEY
jgi:translocation and assembly module TamB